VIDRLRKSIIVVLILVLLGTCTIFAQQQSPTPKFGIGLEVGQWRPNDLSSDVTLSPLKESRKHPYIGIMFLKPWRWGMTFRSSFGYWRYCNDEPSPENRAVEISSILIDLKYLILSDVILMPYVSYGIGWFFGAETQSKKSIFTNSGELELGIGINVGTGFDFNITKKLTLAMEFRYHYVKFNRVVAFTENYSGPKINLGIIYLF